MLQDAKLAVGGLEEAASDPRSAPRRDGPRDTGARAAALTLLGSIRQSTTHNAKPGGDRLNKPHDIPRGRGQQTANQPQSPLVTSAATTEVAGGHDPAYEDWERVWVLLEEDAAKYSDRTYVVQALVRRSRLHFTGYRRKTTV